MDNELEILQKVKGCHETEINRLNLLLTKSCADRDRTKRELEGIKLRIKQLEAAAI